MKKSQLLGGLAAIAILAAAPMVPAATPFGVTVAQAQDVQVSVNIFFDQLRPHGVWVRHAKYRYVFCPRVDADWRPYTHGRWIYLRDRGWYFKSDEPFGWAVYHYGRWIDDRRLGWCWVPGTHWAPAWVSWRRSNDYVGWAPLPPDEEEGFSIDIDINVDEPPEDDWVFVPVRSFIEPQLSVNIVLPAREPEVYERTEYVGPVVVQNNVVINNNIDIDFIKQQTNTEVKVVEAEQTEDPAAAAQAEVTGDTIQVFAPTIEQPAEDAAPEQAVEPEQAAEELGRPPEGEQPAEGADQPATEEGAARAEGEQPAESAAPAEGEQPADATATECPEGQQLVDDQCVPATDKEQPATETAPAEEQAPADDQAPAADEAAPTQEQAAPADESAAPAEEQAPADEEAAPAGEQPAEPAQCPEGQQLVDDQCVPIEQRAPAERQAPAEEQAAPAVEPATPAEELAAPAEEQAAPAEEEAAPAEEQTPAEEQPLQCPEGQVLVDGKCIPADQAPAQ
jgi:hypothetical protein